MSVLIKGGRVVDPGNIDAVMDILIEAGKIAAILPHDASCEKQLKTRSPQPAAKIINAAGKIVTPGLLDMHVHLREPGHTYKETIATGCRAAAWGGFTSVCAMPNTDPINDNPQVTQFVLDQAAKAGATRVYPAAAVSMGSQGEALCEYDALKASGAVALSDDGRPVMDSMLMRRALEKAKSLGLPIISHCEDLKLAAKGVMNEGKAAKRLGLAGIPNAAEAIMVMRDIALCALTAAPVHIAHVSTRESVRAIRDAKKQNLPVTAETAPHYFTLVDEAVGAFGAQAKMNPPLRTEQDRAAIIEALADGTIDVIATDHAPHSQAEKQMPMDVAANGIIGLETAVGLSLRLVVDNVLTIEDLIAKMSKNPARIIGAACGIVVNNPADITIIDMGQKYTVDAARFQSLSRNTPFDGWNLTGRAVLTMVGGKVVFDEITKEV